ncbi:MAG: amidase [Bacteroidota bacterium]
MLRTLLLILPGTFLLGLLSCQPPSPPLDLEEISVTELQAAYRSGEWTSVQVIQWYLDRIERLDPEVNSLIELNPNALEEARKLDEALAAGKVVGALHGVPVILKDNIDAEGMTTTAGSRFLLGNDGRPDAPLTRQLKDQGALILAKANLSEWANFRASFSSSGWSGVGGQTNNPYDLTRNPCGSSAGTGAAISANFGIIGIGTETNGSIVCPSNHNGLVGVKPTVGLISRSGIVPISFTQDTPGPMTRTVQDAAICLSILTAADANDPKTLQADRKIEKSYADFLQTGQLQGKRLGWYTNSRGRHQGVDSLMTAAIRFFEAQGAEIIEIDRILPREARSASYQLMLYEFKTGLAAYIDPTQAPDSVMQQLIRFNREDSVELRYFDQSIIEAAAAKGDLNDPAYLEALETARSASQEAGIDRVMDEHQLDAIVAPTGGPAWKTDLVNGDNFGLGSSSPAAISGYPNITVPMGMVHGLPVGLSIFGRKWSEGPLLHLAYEFEQGTMHRRAPQFLRP